MKEEKKDIKGKPSSQKGSDGRVPNAFAPIYISYSAGRSNRSGGMKIDPKSGMTQEERAFEKVKKYLQSQYENVTSADLKGGERIKDFEDKFEKSKIVVVVLSNEYLYSEHCMYEWTQMQKSHKTIVYVKTNLYCPNREKLTDHWVKFLKDNIEKKEDLLTLITIEALKNNCYLGEIGKFSGVLKDRIIDEVHLDKKFELSNSNKDVIGNTIEVENKKYEDIINMVNNTNTILIIGDYILKDNSSNSSCRAKEESLMENAIKKLKGLSPTYRVNPREYNRKEYQKNDKFEHEAYERINQYSADYFKDLLETHIFDTIISVSFSKKIDEAIRDYSSNSKLKIQKYVLGPNGDFGIKKDINNSETINFFDTVSLEKDHIYEKTGKVGRIIFAEKEIVDFTVRLTKAMSTDNFKGIFDKKNKVVALGINLPGWALRFIFSSLYINKVAVSILSNRPIDGKTENFLRERNFDDIYQIDEDFISEFINKLKKSKESKTPAISLKKCYLFYFLTEKTDYIETKTNLHCLWDYYNVTERSETDTRRDVEIKVSTSDFVLIYNNKEFDMNNASFDSSSIDWVRKIIEKKKIPAILLYKTTDPKFQSTLFIGEESRLQVSSELHISIDNIIRKKFNH